MKNRKKVSKKVYSAIFEYLCDLVLILIAFVIFNKLPYFRDFLQPQTKDIIYWLAVGYVVCGPFYLILRNLIYPEIYKDSKSKSALVIEYILQNIPTMLKVFVSIPRKKDFMKITIDEKTRVAVLTMVLKFYYIPIMLSFLIGNFQNVEKLWSGSSWNFFTYSGFNSWGYYLVFNIIMLIDTGIFAFGYIFEAKWLKNEIKSVDPYISGWLFAIICYPPFNQPANILLRTENSLYTFFPEELLSLFLLIALFCYFIYGWATLALWTKSSNLTNRGIVLTGPYRFVRHPAYIAKNIAWWMEKLPYITTWAGFISMFIWNLIYLMRALTEERHLLADNEYRKYVRRVRWRFIPGLI